MFSHVGWWEMDKGRSVHRTQSVHREVLLSSVHMAMCALPSCIRSYCSTVLVGWKHSVSSAES